MTDEQKASEEKYGTPFGMAFCVEMMERMGAQQGERCGCAEMISGIMIQTGSGNCAEMMETCCAPQSEEEK